MAKGWKFFYSFIPTLFYDAKLIEKVKKMNQKHTMEAENHGESWHRPLRFTYFLLSLLFLFMKHANGQSPTGQPSNEPTAQPSGMKKANL